MNKLIINGNLVNDIEVSVGKSYTVANFTIANNEKYGDKETTTFLRCSLFGEKRVRALEEYLVKGAKVLLDGKLEITSRENKEGWQNYTSLIVDTLEIQKFVNNDEDEEEEEKPKGKKKSRKK